MRGPTEDVPKFCIGLISSAMPRYEDPPLTSSFRRSIHVLDGNDGCRIARRSRGLSARLQTVCRNEVFVA